MNGKQKAKGEFLRTAGGKSHSFVILIALYFIR